MGAFDDYKGFDLEITTMPESGICGIDGYCPDSRDYFHYKEFIKATFERFQGLWIREPYLARASSS